MSVAAHPTEWSDRATTRFSTAATSRLRCDTCKGIHRSCNGLTFRAGCSRFCERVHKVVVHSQQGNRLSRVARGSRRPPGARLTFPRPCRDDAYRIDSRLEALRGSDANRVQDSSARPALSQALEEFRSPPPLSWVRLPTERPRESLGSSSERVF